MASFQEAWARVDVERDGQRVSPELRPLLEAAYDGFVADSPDVSALRRHVKRILKYLASSEGRTHANCWATDLFFGLAEGWERDWTAVPGLPNRLHEVVVRMGQALHDTVKSPAIAENFECLPEQLLELLQREEL